MMREAAPGDGFSRSGRCHGGSNYSNPAQTTRSQRPSRAKLTSDGPGAPVSSAEVDELVTAVAAFEDHGPAPGPIGDGCCSQRCWLRSPTQTAIVHSPSKPARVVVVEHEVDVGRELGGVPGRLLDDARHAAALHTFERRGQRRPTVPAQHQRRDDVKRGSLLDLHFDDVVAIRVLNEQLHPADPPLNPILSIAAEVRQVQPAIPIRVI